MLQTEKRAKNEKMHNKFAKQVSAKETFHTFYVDFMSGVWIFCDARFNLIDR